MSLFKDRVDVSNFSIENIDVSDIDRISNFLPRNGVIDINIAEKGIVFTLEGQNLCQEKIAQIERWIGLKETEKNRAWTNAAITKSKSTGIKTAKEKEWFAQSDDDYIDACNELTLAKACKKWFENKASYFSGWHYAFKTFLRRDYSLENIGSSTSNAYNLDIRDNPVSSSVSRASYDEQQDLCGDIEWK